VPRESDQLGPLEVGVEFLVGHVRQDELPARKGVERRPLSDPMDGEQRPVAAPSLRLRRR
jgi:hypothetical protein